MATLLDWRGDAISAEELGAAFGEVDAPISQEEVQRLFAAVGFDGEWFSSEVDGLGSANRPFMALISDEIVRSVLVRDIRQGIFYVFDPRMGNVLIDAADFAEIFAGIVLIFESPPMSPRDEQPTP